MSARFTIRQVPKERGPSGNYEYEIFDGADVVAKYWHDFRGDEHGIQFLHGHKVSWPVGRMIDFISGGGPEPLALSPAAIAWLAERLSKDA